MEHIQNGKRNGIGNGRRFNKPKFIATEICSLSLFHVYVMMVNPKMKIYLRFFFLWHNSMDMAIDVAVAPNPKYIRLFHVILSGCHAR